MMRGLKRNTPPAVKHWLKCLTRPEYRRTSRELARLRRLPRYHPAVTSILGAALEIVDGASFVHMYQEIIDQEIYRFRARTDAPLIIDGGANIGLSVLYFKRIYPLSRILAFEPDDRIFRVLQGNIARSGLAGVELVHRALWRAETTLPFASDGADAGRIVQAGDQATQDVQTARLRGYLGGQVDLLKLDVEGAETEVLEDCADLLGNVENLFVEYHSLAERPQTLHLLLAVLAQAGFRLHLHPVGVSPKPFLSRNVQLGMDMQLNIFAFRP